MTKIVRRQNGTILYTVDSEGRQKSVRDGYGHYLGYISEGKTWDAGGRMVADGESPGLLVK